MVSAEDWVSSGSIERERIEPLRVEPPPYYIAKPQIVDLVAYLQFQQRLQAMQEQAAKAKQLAYETPLRFGQYAEEQERQRQLEQMNEIQRRVYTRERGQDFVGKALGATIPKTVRRPVVQAVEQGLPATSLGQAAMVWQQANRVPGLERVTPDDTTEFVAETIVPQYYWELALEFAPGFGTVPDLMRAARSGAPEARRALRQAMDSPLARRLASERGGGAPTKLFGEVGPKEIQQAFRPSRTRMVPGARVFATDRNNFGRIISLDPQANTAKVYFRSPQGGEATVDLPVDTLNVITSGGRKVGTKLVPLKADELRQAWELLPPENQKFIGVVAQNSLPETERAARLAASRSGKAQDIAAIMRGPGTPDEKFAAMWGARRGADLPQQKALREFFDDADIGSYKQQILYSRAK